MYIQEQWLWDRELKQPVQYMGVEIRIKGPSVWHSKVNGHSVSYEFSDSSWWKNRFAALCDVNRTLFAENCKPGASQFYGGPFPDCVEIVLKKKPECSVCEDNGCEPEVCPKKPDFVLIGYHMVCERHARGIYERYYSAEEVDAFLGTTRSPLALTNGSTSCIQAIIEHNDKAVVALHNATMESDRLRTRIGVLENYLTNLDCEWEYTFKEKK